MQGQSIKQAKTSLVLALLQLNQQDSFNIIAFNDTSWQLFNSTQMVTSASIDGAQRFIDRLMADGGTQMYQPLSQALAMPRSEQQQAPAIRQIIFITDGAVSNEFELMRLLSQNQNQSPGQDQNDTPNQANYRLYTVGIGAAPNGYFMKKAAQFGRGHYVFIQQYHQVQAKITELLTKISQPVLTDLRLIFAPYFQQALSPGAVQAAGQGIEVYPKKLPDLYAGQPLQVAIKSSEPLNHVELLANTLTQAWHQPLVVDEQRPATGVATLWARRKIADLLDGFSDGRASRKS